jgi:hypothetical protein
MRGGLRRNFIRELCKREEYQQLQSAFIANPGPETFDTFMDHINDEIKSQLEGGDLEKLGSYSKQQLQKEVTEFTNFLYYGLRRNFIRELSGRPKYRELQSAFLANPGPETFDPFVDYINDEITPQLEGGDLEKLGSYSKQQLQKEFIEFTNFLYYDLAREDLPDVETCKELSTLERAPGGTPMTYYYRIDNHGTSYQPRYQLRLGPGAIGCMTTADYTEWDKAVINGVFNGNIRYAIPLSSRGARDESGAYVGPPVSSFTMPPAPSGGRRAKKTRRLAPKPSKPTTARHINGKRRNRKVLKH